MLKVGIKIIRIHNAVVYNRSIPNILAPYIRYLFNERLKYKDTNEVLSNSYKLLINSLYGKTVCKDNNESYLFTTEKLFKQWYCDSNLLDFDKTNTNQILMKYNSSIKNHSVVTN